MILYTKRVIEKIGYIGGKINTIGSKVSLRFRIFSAYSSDNQKTDKIRHQKTEYKKRVDWSHQLEADTGSASIIKISNNTGLYSIKVVRIGGWQLNKRCRYMILSLENVNSNSYRRAGTMSIPNNVGRVGYVEKKREYKRIAL